MKRIVAVAVLAAGLAARATEPLPPPGPPPGPPPFRAGDFAWSTETGSATIRGQVDYAPGRARYGCAGQPVILTPDTPFSRWRIEQLYGSFDKVSRCVELDIDILIDDSPLNIGAAIERGIATATILHPWNAELCEVEDVLGARDWDELARLLAPVLAAPSPELLGPTLTELMPASTLTTSI